MNIHVSGNSRSSYGGFGLYCAGTIPIINISFVEEYNAGRYLNILHGDFFQPFNLDGSPSAPSWLPSGLRRDISVRNTVPCLYERYFVTANNHTDKGFGVEISDTRRSNVKLGYVPKGLRAWPAPLFMGAAYYVAGDDRLHHIKTSRSIPIVLDGRAVSAYLGGSRCLMKAKQPKTRGFDVLDVFTGDVVPFDTVHSTSSYAATCPDSTLLFLIENDGTRISRFAVNNSDTSFFKLTVSSNVTPNLPQHTIIELTAAAFSSVPVAKYRYSIGDSVFDSGNGSFQFRFSQPGLHTQRVQVFDVAGNILADTNLGEVFCARRSTAREEIIPTGFRDDLQSSIWMTVTPSSGMLLLSGDSTTIWRIDRQPLQLNKMTVPPVNNWINGQLSSALPITDTSVISIRRAPIEVTNSGAWCSHIWNVETQSMSIHGHHGCAHIYTESPASSRGWTEYHCVYSAAALQSGFVHGIGVVRSLSTSNYWMWKRGDGMAASLVRLQGGIGEFFASSNRLTVTDVDVLDSSRVLVAAGSILFEYRLNPSPTLIGKHDGYGVLSSALYLDSSRILTNQGILHRVDTTWQLGERLPFSDVLRFIRATARHILILRSNADTIGCVFDVPTQSITSVLGSSHGIPRLAAYANTTKELFILDSFGILGVYSMPGEITSYRAINAQADSQPRTITPQQSDGMILLEAPEGATDIEAYDMRGQLLTRVRLQNSVDEFVKFSTSNLPARSVVAIIVRSPTGVTRHLIMTP